MAPTLSRTMKPTLLVAGASGFIASHLLSRLQNVGYGVVTLSRRPFVFGNTKSVVARNLTADGYTELLRNVDGIVWLAGASTPSSSAGRPLAELDDNLRPLLELMEASIGLTPKRMVFVSTGGAIYGDVRERNATETSHVEPKAYYSAGKAAAEAFLSAWAHEGKHSVTVLRPSNVYGPGQPYRRGFGIVPTVFHSAMTGEPVVIRGDGQAIRDYLYVSDLIDLIMNVLGQPATMGTHTFNASSSIPVPLNQLLDLIDEITGKPVLREYRPASPYDVDRVVLDNSKACETFGWAPRVGLRDGLERSWSADR
ncbi:NAD-dependent epimerase/dehydratase family protein [Luteibacter jiangsuensis]|uniref:NAD-dependent epimerase/dehydratase family protein n=1 Tax=Luteibacter jiangsuensis TaxID=637577 RepID=A0ABX0Q6F7_9GAMM|nr:NAD-dependent epimerase/dehydratase family protein [Luteibacter jiangsuensis]NID05217.1 NAD-dependent epimerase/dehydratase family protein [Luteibacter jiangsuensis]